jgi:hypothetical protein
MVIDFFSEFSFLFLVCLPFRVLDFFKGWFFC